ncbi:uncharacterized protein [Physcomitrium patens]|uniref:uncharacterized protein isoform X3 n=1 Tax=Physcomitrium patens TaxID=3218 RepID=UPI003CCCB9EE
MAVSCEEGKQCFAISIMLGKIKWITMVWDSTGLCDAVGSEPVWLLRDLSCGVPCLMSILTGTCDALTDEKNQNI